MVNDLLLNGLWTMKRRPFVFVFVFVFEFVFVFVFVAQEAVYLGSTKKPQMLVNDRFWSVDVGR